MRSAFRQLKESAGLIALILGLLGASAISIGAFLRDHSISLLWGAVIAFVAVVTAVYARDIPWGRKLKAAVRDTTGATRYIDAVEQIIHRVHHSMKSSDMETAAERLREARTAAFDALITGAKEAREDDLQAVLWEPLEKDGRAYLTAVKWRGRPKRPHNLNRDESSTGGWAWVNRKGKYLPETEGHRNFQVFEGQVGVRSVYAVPLLDPLTEQPTGVLSLASSRPDALHECDRQFVQAAARIFAILGDLSKGMVHAGSSQKSLAQGLQELVSAQIAEGTNDDGHQEVQPE